MRTGDAYASAAERFVALLEGVDDDLPIAATPGWTARDLLGHVVGVASDVVAGDVAAYAQPEWTEAQVESRRSMSRQGVLAEWHQLIPSMQAVMRNPVSYGLDRSFGRLPVIDLLAHEHDLREATGVGGFVDPHVWEVVADRRREVLEVTHMTADLPALEVRTPQGDRWTFGAGERVVVVADRYEFWRSLEGRRPRSVARGFSWSADPEPFLDRWTGFVFEWAPEPPP